MCIDRQMGKKMNRQVDRSIHTDMNIYGQMGKIKYEHTDGQMNG